MSHDESLGGGHGVYRTRMDLAACRPSLAGRNQRVRRDHLRATGESSARMPSFPHLRSSSRSSSVSQPLLRVCGGIGFRFDLAPGLLSHAIDAAETKDGSSRAHRGGGFGRTLPHSGFNPENGRSPVPEQPCRPRAGSRQRDLAVDSHSFRERHESSRSVCSRRPRHVVAHADEEEHTAAGEVLHRCQLGSAARW